MFDIYSNDNRADLSAYDPESGVDVEEDYGFSIDSPELADWAVEKIKERQQRRDLYLQAINAKIEKLKIQKQDEERKCTEDTQFFKQHLHSYIHNVPAKKTKTQLSLNLPSGTIVLKLPKAEMKPNEDILKKNLDGTEYVSYEPKFAWGEYKKKLEIKGNMVIDKTTGELVYGVAIETSQEILEVK